MKIECEFVCIDGNVAKKNVVGFCKFHKGYLTHPQALVHKCYEKKCNKFVKLFDHVEEIYEASGYGIYAIKITK